MLEVDFGKGEGALLRKLNTTRVIMPCGVKCDVPNDDEGNPNRYIMDFLNMLDEKKKTFDIQTAAFYLSVFWKFLDMNEMDFKDLADEEFIAFYGFLRNIIPTGNNSSVGRQIPLVKYIFVTIFDFYHFVMKNWKYSGQFTERTRSFIDDTEPADFVNGIRRKYYVGKRNQQREEAKRRRRIKMSRSLRIMKKQELRLISKGKNL